MKHTRRLAEQRRILFGLLGLIAPACVADPEADTDAGAGGGAGGGGGGAVRPADCVDPTALLAPDGRPSGFERCDDGRIHRAARTTCPDPRPAGAACALEDTGCTTDADCTDRPNGRCIDQSSQLDYCGCVYGCGADADCPEGQICTCGGAPGSGLPEGPQCVPAACATTADCGDGELCMLGSANDGCSTWYALGCTSPADTCRRDEDCGDGYSSCIPDEAGHFTCNDHGVCGRPFMVEGGARTAAPCFGAAWLGGDTAPSAGAAAALSQAEGEALTGHWLAMAALEHASVASFAQFALGLMAQAAPPSLLVETARAMADEVDHARRCYAVASALAGAPLAPGPLDTADARPAPDLYSLVVATLREACVGETLGAAEAAFMAESVVDAAQRAHWRVIADDELRHAALGWETLKWALGLPHAPTHGEVRTAVLAAVAEIVQGIADDRVTVTPAMRSLGLLPALERRALFLDAAEALIGPTLEAILRDSADRAA